MVQHSAAARFLSTFAILLLPLCLRSEEVRPGRYAVGLIYSGASARCFLGRRAALELKGQFGSNIVIYGLRGYVYFNPRSKIPLFAGLEGDGISFKEDHSKGAGYAAGAFTGGEYFFTRTLSFQMDCGASYISLDDNRTTVSRSGVEFVANVGLNLYFGKRGR